MKSSRLIHILASRPQRLDDPSNEIMQLRYISWKHSLRDDRLRKNERSQLVAGQFMAECEYSSRSVEPRAPATKLLSYRDRCGGKVKPSIVERRHL